jgi:hypothetical protein
VNEAFDVDVVQGRRTLWVHSDDLESCIRHAAREDIDVVGFNRARGYALDDLEPVRALTGIRGLHIVFPDGPGRKAWRLEPIHETLVLSAACDIELSAFSKLREFTGSFRQTLGLEKCQNLKYLELWGYSSKSRDLSEFPRLRSLASLRLQRPHIDRLEGIGGVASLPSLEVIRATKLVSLQGLEETHLTGLVLDTCRAIRDHHIVGQVPSLEVLRMNNCGTIPSLEFVNRLPRLEEFRFVDTDVADGDLSPLLRLKAVGFLAKRGFSHTPAQFLELGIKG